MRVNEENRTMDMMQLDIDGIFHGFTQAFLFKSKNILPEKIVFPMFPMVHTIHGDIPIEYVPVESEVAKEIATDTANVQASTPEELDVALEEGRVSQEKLEEVAEEEEENDNNNAEETKLDEAHADMGDFHPANDPANQVTKEELRELQEQVSQLTKQLHESRAVQLEDLGAVPEKAMSGIVQSVISSSPAKAALKQVKGEETAKSTAIAGVDTEHQPTPERAAKAKAPANPVPDGVPISDSHPRSAKDQAQAKRDLVDGPDLSDDNTLEVSEEEFNRMKKVAE